MGAEAGSVARYSASIAELLAEQKGAQKAVRTLESQLAEMASSKLRAEAPADAESEARSGRAAAETASLRAALAALEARMGAEAGAVADLRFELVSNTADDEARSASIAGHAGAHRRVTRTIADSPSGRQKPQRKDLPWLTPIRTPPPKSGNGTQKMVGLLRALTDPSPAQRMTKSYPLASTRYSFTRWRRRMARRLQLCWRNCWRLVMKVPSMMPG